VSRKIFDAHCDTLLRSEDWEGFTKGSRGFHVDLPSLLKSGVHDQIMAVCIEPHTGTEKMMWNRGLKNFEKLGDIEEPRLHFALEGCLALAKGWSLPFHPLVASLTWNGDNPYAGGIGSDMDLTDMGRKLAERFIQNGTALDVSHLNDRSRKSLLKMGFPVCATHCNARKLCNGHNRNLPDEDIVEIASRGGVTGITFVPAFLEDNKADATIDSVLNHLEYVAELTSVDSVGFGSDFDGVASLPNGIDGVGSWQKVLHGLENRGWSDADINKVAGENWRRYFRTDKEIAG
jgi:membrane dipeptidase